MADKYQYKLSVVFQGGRRKILTSNWTLHAGIANVPDITHFSEKVKHQNILRNTREPGKLYHQAASREREYMQ